VLVAVCLITRQRPQSLRRSLESLCSQRLTDPGDRIVLVVIDNDPDGSALPVVDSFARERPELEVRSGLEPTPGIPHARNRALDEAGALGADAVAFIDDDETAEPDWVERLLVAHRATGAEVVTGPARPILDGALPRADAEWITKGRFFHPKEHEDGGRLTTAFTNNVLISRAAIEAQRPFFNPAFARAGGSDAQAFRRLCARGMRIVWAADAITYEHIPASRATEQWIVQRAYRVGNARAHIDRDLRPGLGTALTLRGIAVYRSVKGALLRRIARDTVTRVRAERHLAYARGIRDALRGERYQEYTTVHGS